MQIERAKEIVSKFSGKKVLVVGDVMLDKYVHGSVNRENPESEAPLLEVEKVEKFAGGAGNVAKNVVTLGSKAILVGAVGDDKAAEDLAGVADVEGIRVDFVVDENRPTTKKTRYFKGEEALLRVDTEKKNDLSGELERELVDKVKSLINGGEVEGIIISDYAKGVITERVGREIIVMAGENILVAGDAKPARLRNVKGSSFVSPNFKEAREFVGEGSVEEVAKKVSEKLDTVACVTLSADGMFVCGEEGNSYVPQNNSVKVFDVSGAGDTAIATLLLARMSGADWEESALLANAAGAVAVEKIGTVGVTTEEIIEMIGRE